MGSNRLLPTCWGWIFHLQFFNVLVAFFPVEGYTVTKVTTDTNEGRSSKTYSHILYDTRMRYSFLRCVLPTTRGR